MRKFTHIILGLLVITLLFPPAVFGWRGDRPVTPYGDFCPECSHYGACRFMMGPEEAEKALESYYGKKGLDVEIRKTQGRFIRARILEGKEVVDEIIFDRKTGRIRSIY